MHGYMVSKLYFGMDWWWKCKTKLSMNTMVFKLLLGMHV